MSFLFERLAAGSELYPDQAPAFDLRAAVLAQIERIVSVRPLDGVSGDATLLEFGMPSVVDLAQDGVAELDLYARRLLRLIERFEPRLLRPRVGIVPGPGRLTPHMLVVTGVLAPDAGEQPVRFELSDF